ncbi:MAG: hypothetical protein IPM29_15970 [Planctomycetes bacterium]|nr:hypothetical protein [Planctomycetota bacterium]
MKNTTHEAGAQRRSSEPLAALCEGDADRSAAPLFADCAGVLDVAELDRLLAVRLRAADVEVTDAGGRAIDARTYADGTRATGALDVPALLAAIRCAGLLRVPRLERHDHRVADRLRELRAALRPRAASCAALVAGPGATFEPRAAGRAAHTVLHVLAGRARLCGAAAGATSVAAGATVEVRAGGELRVEAEELLVAWVIEWSPYRVSDLLARVVRERVAADVALREALPSGCVAPGDDAERAVTRARFAAALGAIAPRVTADARPAVQRAVAGLRAEVAAACDPLARALTGAVAAERLGPDARVSRSAVAARLRDAGERVLVDLGDRSLSFPSAVRAELRCLLGGGAVRVADVSARLDDASKLRLARELLRAGLLRIDP